MEATFTSNQRIGQAVAEVIARPPVINVPKLEPAKPKRNLPWKKIVVAVAGSALLLGGGVTGYRWFEFLTSHEETDDAYVTGHVHQVSSRINGTVEQVLVDDNEHVKKGQLLAVLDPRDYQVKVEQAEAALFAAQEKARVAHTAIELASTNATGQDTSAQGQVESATAQIAQEQASVAQAQATIAQSKADLKAKEAEVDRAKLDYDRYVLLEKERAISTQMLDGARRDYIVAQESRNAAKEKIAQSQAALSQALKGVDSAKAKLLQARGQVELAKSSAVQTDVNSDQYRAAQAEIKQAQATLDEAKLNLSYTRIYAPADGRVGKKTVEVGHRIEPGQPLLAVVADNLWVVANFKETQLAKMVPHQKVEMKIDSFGSHSFAGTVDSVAPGSGASFALLPPDNATGNFTKIVQRVPVKIWLTGDSEKGFADRLVPGMSVVVTVDVGK